MIVATKVLLSTKQTHPDLEDPPTMVVIILLLFLQKKGTWDGRLASHR